MSVANQISSEFFNMENATRKKILLIDEFWEYKKMPVVLLFAEEITRKIRKAGGSFMPVTQGIDDYFLNESLKAIYDNSSWKFILKQDPAAIDNAISSNKLSASRVLASMLKHIIPKKRIYGEFAVMSGTSILFSRLRTDGVSYYLLTTDSADEKRIQDTAKKYGIDYQDAIVVLGIQRDEPEWDEDRVFVEAGLADQATIKANEIAKKQREEEIRDALDNAMELNSFEYEEVKFFSVENKEYSPPTVVHMSITTDKKEIVQFSEYGKFMVEMGISGRVAILYFEELLARCREKNVGMVVSLDTLVDNRFLNYVSGEGKGALEHIDFLLDLSVSTEEYSLEEIEASLSNWREMGARFHVKRYDYNVNNNLMVMVKPEFVFVDAIRFRSDAEGLRTTVGFANVLSHGVALMSAGTLSLQEIDTLNVSFVDFKQEKEEEMDSLLCVQALDRGEEMADGNI